MAVHVIDRAGSEALIPVEISNEIIKEIPSSSKLLPMMKKLPNMSSKQKTLPVQNALPEAYFLSGDMAQKQTTKAEWEKLTLTAEELAVIIPIPEAVLDDSAFDIWTEIKPQIVEALGIAIDSAILFGTNKPSSWPTPIYNGALAKNQVVTIGTNSDIASDIIGVDGVMAMVEKSGFIVNGFIADATFEAHLRNLRDSNNNLLYSSSLLSSTPSNLLGRPIEYDNTGVFDTSKALMICGDFSKAVYSIRQDVTYKVLDQAIIQDTEGKIVYNLAQQDMIALRVVMRLGVQIANPVTRRGSNGYPFAILAPSDVSPSPSAEPSAEPSEEPSSEPSEE